MILSKKSEIRDSIWKETTDNIKEIIGEERLSLLLRDWYQQTPNPAILAVCIDIYNTRFSDETE